MGGLQVPMILTPCPYDPMLDVMGGLQAHHVARDLVAARALHRHHVTRRHRVQHRGGRLHGGQQWQVVWLCNLRSVWWPTVASCVVVHQTDLRS